jgi:hypothetical protein
MQLSGKLAGLAGEIEGQIFEHGRALGGHVWLGGGRGHGSIARMSVLAGSMAGILNV